MRGCDGMDELSGIFVDDAVGREVEIIGGGVKRDVEIRGSSIKILLVLE